MENRPRTVGEPLAVAETRSAFDHPFVNAWLWGAIALSAALQVAVVHVGVLNTAFATVPLTARDWLGCIALASAALWYSELRKWVRRAWRPAPRAPHPGTVPAQPAHSAPP